MRPAGVADAKSAMAAPVYATAEAASGAAQAVATSSTCGAGSAFVPE